MFLNEPTSTPTTNRGLDNEFLSDRLIRRADKRRAYFICFMPRSLHIFLASYR
jgi:hypothetical protein